MVLAIPCYKSIKHAVAYGAQGLKAAEKNYAQVEKEILAITAGCEKFD